MRRTRHCMPKRPSCNRVVGRARVCAAMWFRCITAGSTICIAISGTRMYGWYSRRNLELRKLEGKTKKKYFFSSFFFFFFFFGFVFDMGLVRAYENDKPAASPDYLKWSAEGSKDGDLVFVAGNPGGTARELTMAQLAFERDTMYPIRIPETAERRGLLEEFITRGPEQGREANDELFFVENSFKAYLGRQGALLDPQFMAGKQQEEQKLRSAVAADAKVGAAASAWDDIAQIQKVRAQLYTRNACLSRLRLDLLGTGGPLGRAAKVRTKPNGERLPEYTDQALVHVQQEMTAHVPVYKDLEELDLTFSFNVIRRDLGADDAFVKKMLGKESPEQLAHRLVSETHLDDPKVREELYNGGLSAIEASQDPMIRFEASIDGDLLAVRKEYESRVDAPTRAAAERIAKARFTAYGTSVDPDA